MKVWTHEGIIIEVTTSFNLIFISCYFWESRVDDDLLLTLSTHVALGAFLQVCGNTFWKTLPLANSIKYGEECDAL